MAGLRTWLDAQPVLLGDEWINLSGVGSVCRFLRRDCEDTQLRADSFDAGLCGMLHHLDLNRAYPELQHVMASGGRLLCVTPRLADRLPPA